jgi:putative cell wall-binding protein
VKRPFRQWTAAVAAALVSSALAVVAIDNASAAPGQSPGGSGDTAALKRLSAVARGQAELRARAATELTTAAILPANCPTSSGDGAVTALRYAGINRYETAICVSIGTPWAGWNSGAPPELIADAVVLARGDLFADALSGGPLAAQAEGPLLLTPPTALRTDVKAEIQRVLSPGGQIYMLGGTGALSSDIEAELKAAGYAVTRIAGANRFETAVKTAEILPETSNFFFATGMNFPDGLAAGNAAATLTIGAKFDDDPNTRPFAVLLTNDASMPAVTRDFADARATALGDSTYLTAGGFADQAAASAFGASALDARFVGANRYETATKIADAIFTEAGRLIGTGVGLATGLDFPDALSATALLALYAEPLLLTQPTVLHSATKAFLQNHAGDVDGAFVDVFGGTGVVPEDIKNAAIAAFTP